MLEDTRETSGGLALVYFNIDRFIDINNVLGVRVGDEVLFVVAQRLLESRRWRWIWCAAWEATNLQS